MVGLIIGKIGGNFGDGNIGVPSVEFLFGGLLGWVRSEVGNRSVAANFAKSVFAAAGKTFAARYRDGCCKRRSLVASHQLSVKEKAKVTEMLLLLLLLQLRKADFCHIYSIGSGDVKVRRASGLASGKSLHTYGNGFERRKDYFLEEHFVTLSRSWR